ncbi:MAG: hypothetical protein HY263_09020 [Chloroflexi bacterium]|nr:hypothetical protein [Chloroflexota bacterium]
MPARRRRDTTIGRDERQLLLLNATLSHAVQHTPFYAERFGALTQPLTDVVQLAQLPLLSREELESHSLALLARDRVPVTVAMTSGTTRPRPLVTFRSAGEGTVRNMLFASLAAGDQPRPLFLHLVNAGHGFDVDAAIPGAFQVPLERWFHYQAVLDLLEGSYSFPGFASRVGGLAGALRLLKALTVLCIENDVDPGRFEIALVSSSSDHLTSRWRGILSSYWGAAIDDVYGLSEVPGLYARRCLACNHFRFSPLAVVERLELGSDAPASGPIGRLVATSLFPLAAMQPVIRYDTGDVIEVALEACPWHEEPGFELLGRASQLVVRPASTSGPSRVLLSSILLNEVLDSIPDIAVSEYGFTRGLGLKASIGLQKWKLQQSVRDGVPDVELGLELRWSPREHPGPAEALRSEVRARVLAARPALGRAVDEGGYRLTVQLHEPGSTDFWALV